MTLESGETVTTELVANGDGSSPDYESAGLTPNGYRAQVDNGSIKWTDNGVVYAKTGIMFDTDETDVESIKVVD